MITIIIKHGYKTQSRKTRNTMWVEMRALALCAGGCRILISATLFFGYGHYQFALFSYSSLSYPSAEKSKGGRYVTTAGRRYLYLTASPRSCFSLFSFLQNQEEILKPRVFYSAVWRKSCVCTFPTFPRILINVNILIENSINCFMST